MEENKPGTERGYNPIAEAQRNKDLAVHAYSLVTTKIEQAVGFTPEEAQKTAATYLFYVQQLLFQARTYRMVYGEFTTTPTRPLENDLRALALSIDPPLKSAEKGRYKKMRRYLEENVSIVPEGEEKPFDEKLNLMISKIEDFGPKFKIPPRPHQDPKVAESFNNRHSTASLGK